MRPKTRYANSSGVHIAARVMDETGASKIMVSSMVRDLMVGAEVASEDRGKHILKGIEGEWRLYEAVL